MNSRGYGPAVLDKSSTNYNAIRGREQMLIIMEAHNAQAVRLAILLMELDITILR